VKSRLNRAIVTVGFTLAAASFFGVGCLYLIYAFFMWLASNMSGPLAALATAGLVILIGILILAGLALSRPRRAPASAASDQARQLGQAVGMAAITRLILSLLRKISPRLIVMGVAAATVVLLVSLVWRRNRDS
jgi:hypothetical protein